MTGRRATRLVVGIDGGGSGSRAVAWAVPAVVPETMDLSDRVSAGAGALRGKPDSSQEPVPTGEDAPDGAPAPTLEGHLAEEEDLAEEGELAEEDDLAEEGELARIEGPPLLLEPGREEEIVEIVTRLCGEVSTRARQIVQRPAGSDSAAPGRVHPAGPPVVRPSGSTSAAFPAEASPAAVWVGLAGAGQEVLRRGLEDALRGSGIAERVGVGTDVEAAFQDVFGRGPGITLIAGTGSALLARVVPDGPFHQIGGWGRFMGDEGSGYGLGVEALRAVARARDGRGEETFLKALLLEAAGVDREEGLIAWTTAASKDRIAALAPRVVEAAEEGDPVASALLDRAAAALREHLEAALRLCRREGGRPEALTLVLHGGLAQPGRALRSRLESATHELGLRIRRETVRAERGAARRALLLLRE